MSIALAAYSPRKKLSLIWAGGMSPLLTFTRTTAGSYLAASGLLASAAAGVIRPEYDTVGQYQGVLLEGSVANAVYPSIDFSSARWVGAASGTGSVPVATANYGVSPDGTMNATRIQMTKGSGTATSDYTQISQTTSGYTGGTIATHSVWMKSISGSSVLIQYRDDASTGITAKILTVTTAWQRFFITGTVNVSGNVANKLWLRGSQGTSDTADILIYDGQTEAGAMSSNIVTVSASASRSADILQLASLGPISATRGTFVMEHDAPSGAPLIYSGSNPILISTGPGKMAIAYDSSGNVTSLNGSVVTTSATALTFSTTLDIGKSPTASMNGHIKTLTYYDTARRTDLPSLTTLVPAIQFLFNNGEKGLIYDPSDFSTLWQDAAATIPVTALEQLVYVMKDKSGNNNHWTAANSTSARVTVSARHNRMTSTEVVTSSAPWFCSASAFTITANAISPPAGYANCSKLTVTSSGNIPSISFEPVPFTAPPMAVSIMVHGGNRTTLDFDVINSSTFAALATATLTIATGVMSGTGASNYTVVSAGSGWFLVTLSLTSAAGYGVSDVLGFYYGISNSVAVGKYWHVTGISLQWGARLMPYQQVTSATVYNSVGFPVYLQFNGTSRGATPAIDFSGTNKMSIFAGISAMQSTSQMLVALGAYAAAGTMELATGEIVASGLIISRASPSTVYNYETPAPSGYRHMVVTATLDGSVSAAGGGGTLRVNGTAATAANGGASVTLSAFSNAAMYVGSSSSSARILNARMYSLIVRGAATLTQDIPAVEAWVNSKTQAY